MKPILPYLDVLGPLLSLLYCFTSKGDKAGGYSYLIAFLVFQLLTNGTAKITMHMGCQNNILVYKFNAFFAFITACGWFRKYLSQYLTPISYKRINIYILVSFTLLIVALILEKTEAGLNSFSLSLTAFTICILAIIYFLRLFTAQYDEYLFKNSHFWIAIAFFVYYAPCFFVFLVYKILNVPKGSHYADLWFVQNGLLFLCASILGFVNKERK